MKKTLPVDNEAAAHVEGQGLSIAHGVEVENVVLRRPQWLLSLALLLTVLILVGVGAHVGVNTLRDIHSRKRSNEIESLRGEIMLLDEVLTMSARIGAATGDQRWEARYRTAEPRLMRAINRALTLVGSEAAAAAVVQTDEANLALVAMEYRAFDLVRGDDQVAAAALLSSSEYESQKLRYVDGMNLLANRLASEVQAATAEARVDAWTRLGMLSGAIVILIVVCTVGIWVSRVWRRQLLHSADQLRHRADDLEQLNATLDLRVAERTAHLDVERRRAEASANALSRERAESASRSAELEAILASMSEGVVVADMSGRFMLVNRAAEAIIGAGAFDGRLEKWSERYGLFQEHGETPYPTDELPLAQAMRGETVKNVALVSRHEDRPEGLHIEVSATPVVAEDGSQIAAVATFRDISERVAAEAEQASLQSQLAQAQKLESIGQLAAGIAHEINTPTQYVGDNTRFLEESFREFAPLLNKADELAEAVRKGTGSYELADELKAAFEAADVDYLSEEIPRAIEQSLNGLDRVRKIVQSMKEFSHPGVEGMTSLDLNRAIENTITIATHEWKFVAKMETDFDPELPPVPCLPGEFNQVVLNMIVNAAHAIADVVGDGEEGKGTVTISTRRDGEFVEMRIADTGTGIPEESRGKIFDPFFTTKEIGKGTGQGLSIARSVVVQKHGGTLEFETEIGNGTTFIIRLPLERQGVVEPV